MTVRGRDLAVLTIAVVGLLASVAAWHGVGRWAALLVLVTTVLAAATAYRLRPSAVPWRGPVVPGDEPVLHAAVRSTR